MAVAAVASTTTLSTTARRLDRRSQTPPSSPAGSTSTVPASSSAPAPPPSAGPKRRSGHGGTSRWGGRSSTPTHRLRRGLASASASGSSSPGLPCRCRLPTSKIIVVMMRPATSVKAPLLASAAARFMDISWREKSAFPLSGMRMIRFGMIFSLFQSLHTSFLL